MFQAIFVDEAHHSTATTYMNIFRHFGALTSNTLKLWGCTATPSRTDEGNILSIFNYLVYKKTLIELMREKYLCPIVPHPVHSHIKVAKNEKLVSTSGNDFELNELSSVVNSAIRNKLIVSIYHNIIKSQQRNLTVIFACDLDHCYTIYAWFLRYFENPKAFERECEDLSEENMNEIYEQNLKQQEQGPWNKGSQDFVERVTEVGKPSKNSDSFFADKEHSVVVITGKTKKDVRNKILEKSKEGKIRIIINCQVFTEGVDIPNIDSIMIARPTLSSLLYYQMIGRGLRISPSKKNCMIIDVVDNFEENFIKAITTQSLFGIRNFDNLPGGLSVLEIYDNFQKNQISNLINFKKEINLTDALKPLENYNTNETSYDSTLIPSEIVEKYTQLQWQRIENKNRFILILGHESQFLLIEIQKTKRKKNQKVENYFWNSSGLEIFDENSLFLENNFLYNPKTHNVEYFAIFKKFGNPDVLIARSVDLEKVKKASEDFVQFHYPYSHSQTLKSAPWRKLITEKQPKMPNSDRFIRIPVEEFMKPFTKERENFYIFREQISLLFSKKLKAFLHDENLFFSEKERSKMQEELKTFSESQLAWTVTTSNEFILPFANEFIEYIDVDEFFPNFYSANFIGTHTVPLHHVNRSHSSDPFINLKNTFLVAENFVYEHYPTIWNVKERNAAWKDLPASKPQLLKLNSLSIPYSAFITKGEASDLISKHSLSSIMPSNNKE